PNQTINPLTCHGFRRIQGGGTGINGPNITKVTSGPCSQQIAAGQRVTQTIKLGGSPCGNNPLAVYLFIGGEPDVTSFVAPASTGPAAGQGPGGESTTVGESLSHPINVNMKAYKGCQKIAGAKKSSAGTSAATTNNFPAVCSGLVIPHPTRVGIPSSR